MAGPLEAAAARVTGAIEQIPPVDPALKREGVPPDELAPQEGEGVAAAVRGGRQGGVHQFFEGGAHRVISFGFMSDIFIAYT